ncbi:signal peptide protein [Streptomyces sp. NPDC001928]|uniref:signal peptide protein n=1 Tax=Streptomyces sp. NPDC001928 TaxID=3154404 RepID=UPI003329D192
MSLKNSRPRLAFVALVVALSALAAAGPTMAATSDAAAGAQAAPWERARTAATAPTGFVDLPTSPLRADGGRHEVKVAHRNDATTARPVAPQLLVLSPDAGPFLDPADIRVERRTAYGSWVPVPVGSQAGTLFTDLSAARRTLHPGETFTQVYRFTVVDPRARGTVAPRVALYG